jgi:hypothetical protein
LDTAREARFFIGRLALVVDWSTVTPENARNYNADFLRVRQETHSFGTRLNPLTRKEAGILARDSRRALKYAKSHLGIDQVYWAGVSHGEAAALHAFGPEDDRGQSKRVAGHLQGRAQRIAYLSGASKSFVGNPSYPIVEMDLNTGEPTGIKEFYSATTPQEAIKYALHTRQLKERGWKIGPTGLVLSRPGSSKVWVVDMRRSSWNPSVSNPKLSPRATQRLQYWIRELQGRRHPSTRKPLTQQQIIAIAFSKIRKEGFKTPPPLKAVANPLLLTVANPGRRVPATNPRPSGKIRMNFAQAQAWAKQHGLTKDFDKAVALQTKANRKPTHFTIKRVPMGDPRKVQMRAVMVNYGSSSETYYKAPAGSKKGKALYRHKWGEGGGSKNSVPLLVSPSGKAIVMPLEGKARIDDWMRG